MTERARRLTTIVAIDVAAYSRLMHTDETGTLDRLRAARAVTDPVALEHGGRIVGTWGDGLLFEFPSVVEAVEAACKVQAAMAAFNAGTPEDRQLLYRIGINLGDVIVEDDDLFGDGVNVAARLEALSPPGGVVLSRSARDQVRDKLDIAYEDLGEVEVKNIARPVRAFRVLGDGEVAVAPVRSRRRWPVVAAAAVLLVAIVAGGVWWSAALDGSAEADPILALPEGSKIVVLPFDNLSGDAEQDYFVDGLVEDLTTRLSDFDYLFVIARNSAFKYKGKSPDVRDVGRDLGVDFVVEGSVRRSGQNIRVNAQLLNAKDGTHVWANTYDRALDVEGVFGIQDELTIGIAQAIAGSGGAVRKGLLANIDVKRPETLASFECVLLADNYNNTFLPSIHARARDCLEKAVEREPNYAPAWAALSNMYRREYELGVNRRPDPLRRSSAATNRALKLDPTHPRAHSNSAYTSFALRQMDDAFASIERALELGPNSPIVLHAGADMLMRLGHWERSALLWRKASALDPTPVSWSLWAPMHYYHWRGDLKEAQTYILRLKQQIGNWYLTTAWEAILLAEMDRMDEAREALSRALEQNPNMAADVYKGLEVWWWPQPEYFDRMMNGLYKAGLPREKAPSQ